MSRFTVETELAPSYWAPYLINGDSSGMEDAEVAQCDAWIDRLGYGAPVDCKDWGFGHFEGLGHDLQEYSFLIPNKEMVK